MMSISFSPEERSLIIRDDPLSMAMDALPDSDMARVLFRKISFTMSL